MSKVLIADDDASVLDLVVQILKTEPLDISTAIDGSDALAKMHSEDFDLLITDLWMPGCNGLEVMSAARELSSPPRLIVLSADNTPEALLKSVREQAVRMLHKPFKASELLDAVRHTLDAPPPLPIQVLSARPDWVELIVPCDRRTADHIHEIMLQLKADLPEDVRHSVGQAFRELLMNAVEWGGKLDVKSSVRISFLRARKMLLYRIADPGDGFRFEGLTHSALHNHPDDPIAHMRVREEKGLRPGGLGLLLAKSLVDELIYNEQQNEVVFVKYLE